MHEFLQALEKIISFLDSEEIPYMIFGGIANSIYGIPRQTFDIDIKIQLETEQQRNEFIFRLEKEGKILPDDALQFIQETNVLPVEVDDVRIDFVFAGLHFEKEAIAKSNSIDLFGLQVKVCRPEDLIIHKTISPREKDWLDIKGIVENQQNLNWEYVLQQCKQLSDFLSNPEIYYKILQLKDES